MIPALLLTAGLATRLRPLSLVRAKAALPIAGEPIARRILRALRAQGVTEAVLNLHHLPHTITGRLGDGSDIGVRVRYSWESPVLGSAGGPRRALPLLGAPAFLIVNGDTLTDLDVGALAADHARSGALVTMAVTPNEEPDKYGGVIVDDEGVVTGFVRRGSPRPSYHFIGVQAAQAAAFAGLPDNEPYESVGALYPSLITSRPGSVRAYRCRAAFHDIGTPADYLDTALALAGPHDAPSGSGVRIDPTARVESSVLWDDVEVGPGALLRDCVVTDGACVPGDTSWIGVTIRRADGPLAPGERRIDQLAIGNL